MKFYSHIRPDGELSGNYVCEKCLRHYPKTEREQGVAALSSPDPIKACVVCGRRVGRPRMSYEHQKFAAKQKPKIEWSIKI